MTDPQEPVSVTITVLNEEGSIGRLIDSLFGQDVPPAEIVIVDGGSTDGTPGAIERAMETRPGLIRLIQLPGSNISQGRNAAIAAAAHDLIAVTDAGVRFGPDWLRQITEPLRVQTAGAPNVVAGFFRADPQTLFEAAMGATVLPELRDVDGGSFLPSSRSIAFRREAWEAAGPYPEWLDYCEDIVFDLRLRAHPDVRIAFEPRAIVHFRPRGSLSSFFRQYYRYARGDGKARLWPARHAARYASYLFLAVSLVASVRASSWCLTRFLQVAVGAGGLVYLRKPVRRLSPLVGSLEPSQRLAALFWILIIRLTGDVAKMCGYPVGVWWRIRKSFRLK